MSGVTIVYGPTYNAELTSFLGVPLNTGHFLDQQIYERPTWDATAMLDGRVVVRVNHVSGDNVAVYGNRVAFEAWKRAMLSQVRDSETGRPQVPAACLARFD